MSDPEKNPGVLSLHAARICPNPSLGAGCHHSPSHPRGVGGCAHLTAIWQYLNTKLSKWQRRRELSRASPLMRGQAAFLTAADQVSKIPRWGSGKRGTKVLCIRKTGKSFLRQKNWQKFYASENWQKFYAPEEAKNWC